MIFGSIFKSKWLEIIIQTTLKHQFEDEMIAEYVAQRQQEGDTRDAQDIAEEYNDTVIYPDKVWLNCLNTEVILNTDLHGLNGWLFATGSQRSVGIRGIRVREEVNNVVFWK